MDNTQRLLRIRQVLELVPISRSNWYAGIADGRFPAPIKLGPRTVAWRLEDISKVLENGIEPQKAA